MVGGTIGPYQILARLGAGGMGEVFLGHDPRLQRRVALKCLTASDAQTGDTRARILREARAVARLNHPNIAAVYDVLEQDGRTFIVMEYVEGESLAARLARGPMPLDQVRWVGCQLAAALAAAHAHGVIHRDLKPANVHFDGERSIKVLDFGVAKLSTPMALDADAATGVLPPEPTLAGSPGTVTYMSPEQLLGGEIDGRSDVYSAGVMLYEMATGRRPFDERGVVSLALAISSRAAPSSSTVNPEVPADLAAIIARALERDPGRRFSSAAEMENALTSGSVGAILPAPAITPRSRVAMAVLLVVALALGAVVGRPLWTRRFAAPATEPAGRRIVVAVLPLENLSGDPAKDYLGAGVAETLMMALSKVPSLTVLSRGEVMEVLRRDKEIRRVASDLDASFVVDGSVQQAGDRLRVTLRVVRPDATVAWSEAYEDTIAAVFALHRTMAADIVDKIQGRAPDAVDLTVPATTNVEALTSYWQGRSMLDRAVSKSDFVSAASMFERAIALDAAFALGYAGLSDTLWQQYQVTHDIALPAQALEAGLTALRLDANQPATRIALATVYQGMGQNDAAIDQLKRALDLQPSNDDAHRIYARVLNAQGRPDEAIGELRQAIAIRPHRWANYSELGRLYYQQRRLTDAASIYERALEILPNDPRSHLSLGAVFLEMGDVPRSLELFQKANTIAPTGLALSNIGTAYYRLERFGDAVDAYTAALRLDPKSPLLHGNLGDALLRLNRTDAARREFTAARDLLLEALKVNDKDARSLSRLGAFEAKLGMPADAAAHAAQAVAIAPRDPDVRYKQAVVASLGGRRAEALRILEEALASGYKADDARADYDLAGIKDSAEFAAIVARQQ